MLVRKADKNCFLNVLINNPIDAKSAIPAQIQTTLRNPIVDVPTDYNLIVSRFSIPATSIPLFIFKTLGPPNVDPDTGIYSLGFEYQGQSTPPINLQWLPQSFLSPQVPVLGPNAPQNPSDPYYFDFSYQNLADMVNNAFKVAIAYVTANFSWPVFDVYMTYTSNTGYFNLLGTQSMASTNERDDTNNIRIWFNTPLMKCFRGFKSFYNATNSPSGQDNMILIANYLNNYNNTQDGFNPNIPIGYYQIPFEYNSDENLQTLSRIIITSNGLGGVVSQAEVSSGLQGGTYANVLTDLVPTAEPSNGSYTRYQYFVQSEFYRRSLTQINPLTEIQLNFYWQGSFGATPIPLMLNAGDNLNVQMIFEAKQN